MMKKIYIFLAILLFVAGCKQDFLDTQNLVQQNSSSYPSNPTQAQAALTGAYSTFYVYNDPSSNGVSNAVIMANIMSDDCFGGGGSNDRDPQAISLFRQNNTNEHEQFWSDIYRGILDCNTLLASINNVTGWTSPAERNQVVGEASFLRGYFYFELARFFGSVPMPLSPIPATLPKATPANLFAQIAADLQTGIDSMSNTPITVSWKQSNMGRASKWAAEGIMARVFLFYTGYYKQSTLPLPGSKSITQAQVVNWVDDLVANSGCSLVPDFRNIWPYAITDAAPNYGYNRNNGLDWVFDVNDLENIFEINYVPINSGIWGQDNNYQNQLGTFGGQRYATPQLPMGHGWGFGQVNPNLYAGWDPNDLRRQGSIWNVSDSTEGTEPYLWTVQDQWEQTGFMNKKYMPIDIVYNGQIVNWTLKYYPAAQNSLQLDNAQNTYLLRLSDVLLMGAELGSAKAQQYFDMVHGRAYSSKSATPYVPGSMAPTLANIQAERRHELAFEGIRYFDLLRWYQGGAGTVIMNNRAGATIWNENVKTTIDLDRVSSYFPDIPNRVQATGGFLAIPQQEISNSNGVLVQNPGWTGSDITY